MTHTIGHRDRGAALIVTLLIVIVLASLVLSMSHTMRVEALAASQAEAQAQARAIANGAAAAIIRWGDNLPTDAVEIGGGAVWFLRVDPEDDKQYAYGMTDEAAKVNINTATVDMLEKLPNMTPELAAAIVDWRDRDEDTTDDGAESDYYRSLDDPYLAKNAPFDTIDELLMVRGFTPLELYGEDANRNGVLDANENDGDESSPPDDGDGKLDRGIYPFITVYSTEPAARGGLNVNSQGNQTRQALVQRLSQSMASDRASVIADNIMNNRPLKNMVDVYIKSQMTLEEFGQVASGLTTEQRARRKVGLINVNKAPLEVLMALPGIEEGEAQALIAYRSGQQDTTNTAAAGDTSEETAFAAPTGDLSSIAWVAEAIDHEKAIDIGSLITVTSVQRSVDIVAVSPGGRAFERYRMVFDPTTSPPTILLWQRLTHLGWPLDRSLLDQLRAGGKVSDLAQSTDRGSF
ncbi:MAG: hypothetical protein GC162_01240 [Planctomycetes bacterium]|nr:hypothetical protein [Planctomycetota bacterium]